jgi:hypothetical protein
MATASVAANIHEALDIHGLLASQVSFDLIICFHGFSQSRHISLTKVFDSGIWIDTCLSEDFFSPGWANSIDIS